MASLAPTRAAVRPRFSLANPGSPVARAGPALLGRLIGIVAFALAVLPRLLSGDFQADDAPLDTPAMAAAGTEPRWRRTQSPPAPSAPERPAAPARQSAPEPAFAWSGHDPRTFLTGMAAARWVARQTAVARAWDETSGYRALEVLRTTRAAPPTDDAPLAPQQKRRPFGP
jgi:hypothetical protein